MRQRSALGLKAAVLVVCIQICSVQLAHGKGVVSTWPLYLEGSTLDPNTSRSATNFLNVSQHAGFA